LFNFIKKNLANPYDLFKTAAFKLDAELAHAQSMRALSMFPNALATVFNGERKFDNHYQINLKSGLIWPTPLGLAAGLDKNAEAIEFFTSIPFGAVEVGTVTPKPQEGNPKPRLFRLVEEESLLNRMGFNNEGMDVVYNNVKKAKKKNKIVGVNLGKNKLTPEDKAVFDYEILYRKFVNVADYLVINISSPNTPGLRDLQRVGFLRELFQTLSQISDYGKVPLFVKLSPDMAVEDLDDIIQVIGEYQLAGLIATNTTIMKDRGEGGISGKLLAERASKMRVEILKRIEGTELDLIGVGGISSFEDIWKFWKAGGRAIQFYSAFIFQGPGMVYKMMDDIDRALKLNGCSTVTELLDRIDEASF
jgi:dihydroorotate dehydrogenase